MQDKLCCGIFDYDGVLVPGEELMDEYVKEICYEASNVYCKELFKQQTSLIQLQQRLELDRDVYGSEMQELLQELEEIAKKIKIHFNLKDQVLEETELKYRNRIDYKEIYQRKNVYIGVLDLLWKIYDCGYIYSQMINNTHVNSETEIIAKRELLKNDFPPMKFVPIRYHIIPYRDQAGFINQNRETSDKVGKLLNILSYIDAPISTLVDNSVSIISRGKKLGLRSYFVEENQDPYIIENPVLNPIPSQIILQAANDTIDMFHDDKVKKLSL